MPFDRRPLVPPILRGLLAAFLGLPFVAGAETATRLLALADLARLRTVSDVQVSPEGDWVAYSVAEFDAQEDRSRRDLWMASWDGARRIRLTWGPTSASKPRWSPDGTRLAFLSARVDDLASRKDGAFAVLAGTASNPPEVSALEGGVLRPLSAHNDWLREVRLGTVEEFSSRSADGTEVHGLLAKPPGFETGRRYPTILWIHGGPNMQDEYSFRFERHFLAARGFVVLSVNYRGGSGRGSAFQKAIFADWGNKEVQDLLGAVDEAVRTGVADPERLGIGGWSYGGILTNYAIARDSRFKAAVSGASSSLQLTMYGTDEYVLQYESELGPHWKSRDLWLRLSDPFFHADRIKTPTLFMGGTRDFNVPVAGAEQMYQALRSLGVETRLVIYPDQRHELGPLSYQQDRLERYASWFGRFLRPEQPRREPYTRRP